MPLQLRVGASPHRQLPGTRPHLEARLHPAEGRQGAGQAGGDNRVRKHEGALHPGPQGAGRQRPADALRLTLRRSSRSLCRLSQPRSSAPASDCASCFRETRFLRQPRAAFPQRGGHGIGTPRPRWSLDAALMPDSHRGGLRTEPLLVFLLLARPGAWSGWCHGSCDGSVRRALPVTLNDS